MKEDAISAIIQRESDRLFIIDRECYVIFTGTSLSDQRPFIRIGNCMDLPVEIIPLVENIVITDLLSGNPAWEQFNIDIKSLPLNRYIGSRLVVNKYLNFQKIFGLDLTNAEIVDVEKDIPILSREKDLGGKDSFIGIFYTNGNFRINRGGSGIMDLSRETAVAFDDNRMHSLMAEAGKTSGRFDGGGVIFIGGNPLFYKNKFFTAYHFPKRYFEGFSALGIDPTRIRDMIHPSANFINITRLIKWKHGTAGRLRLFTNHTEQTDLIKKLFPRCSITRKDFSGFNHDTGDGLSIRNYPETYNIRLNFTKTGPDRIDLSLAYIKGARGMEKITREKLDGILLHYSVYEEISLLMKSSGIPAVIISDTGFSRGKLRNPSIPVIHNGLQYEFRKYANSSDVIRNIAEIEGAGFITIESPVEEIEIFARRMTGALKKGTHPGFDEYRASYNALAFMRIMLESDVDRKRASALRVALQEIDLALDRTTAPPLDPFTSRMVLAFVETGVYELIEITEQPEKAPVFLMEDITEEKLGLIDLPERKEEHVFYQRVIRDRIRLRRLLELYLPRSESGGFRELEKAIRLRKEIFFSDEPRIEEEAPSGERKTAPLKKIAAWVTVLSSLAVIGILLTGHIRSWTEERLRQDSLRAEREKKELVEKYGITVSPHDIFMYANEVALKNGYRKITFQGLKVNNPNWIYPGNRFLLDDDEAITVKGGDTLWEIAHMKLMAKNLRFYKAAESAFQNKSGGRPYAEDIEIAKKFAYSKNHHAMIESLTKDVVDGRKR